MSVKLGEAIKLRALVKRKENKLSLLAETAPGAMKLNARLSILLTDNCCCCCLLVAMETVTSPTSSLNSRTTVVMPYRSTPHSYHDVVCLTTEHTQHTKRKLITLDCGYTISDETFQVPY